MRFKISQSIQIDCQLSDATHSHEAAIISGRLNYQYPYNQFLLLEHPSPFDIRLHFSLRYSLEVALFKNKLENRFCVTSFVLRRNPDGAL